jgi:endonuclease/exonuclease/phosphatase family metal-dependent hydrolase
MNIPAQAADTKPRLRVLTYNIHHGRAMDGKFDYQRLSKVITDLEPDVVALQEVDCKTQRSSGVDQAALLGKLTKMYSVFGQAMPYRGGQYGEAILSRFPIEKVEVHPLPFSPGLEPRTALAVRFTPDNGIPTLVFVGTHLCHQREATRTEQAKQINLVLPAKGKVPHILAGDLNARKGSDPMNVLLKERWVDVVAPRSRIDYILTRPVDPWKVVEVTIVDERVVSDHKPILVVLEWIGETNAKKAAASESITPDQSEWEVVWQDEFTESRLDEAKWTRCRRGGSNWNDTMSVESRLLVINDGAMHLRGIENTDKEKDPAPFLTAGVTSRKKYSFQYGKVQIRARCKSAQGAWPALWMMPEIRPKAGYGEIDIMEHLNFDDKVYQTVHSDYTKKDRNRPPQRYCEPKIKRDDWNTYGIEWDADKIIFTVNGKQTLTYPCRPELGESQWPFDTPYYFILSMQIGGDWVNGSGPTNPEHYPAGLEIDWVRVYKHK